MANWQEIERLAADFQKIQRVSTAQCLSERNWIEIVSLLVQRKLLNVVFTVDGKEYVTTEHLIKEIQTELSASNGRISVADLAKTLNVDVLHISNRISEVLHDNRDIFYVQEQLLDVTYIERIVAEVNERLVQFGSVHVSDLTQHFDLTGDFLQHKVLEKYLNRGIQAKQDRHDSKLFYTEEFLTRCIHKIKGVVHGITRPTSVNAILNQIGITDKLFYSLFDEVHAPGSLTSRTTASQYVPNIYTKSQADWVDTFYKQNDYLEFDSLARHGITDHKTYIKKHLANEKVIYLNSCVISVKIFERFVAMLDECIASKSFINTQTNLPSILTEDDVQSTVKLALSKRKDTNLMTFGNYVLSKCYMDELMAKCDCVLMENAKVIVATGKYQQYLVRPTIKSNEKQATEETAPITKRDERRRRATGGRSGGGTQGRETKTKSTKKHNQNVAVASELERDQISHLEIIDFNAVSNALEGVISSDGLTEIANDLIEYISAKLNEQGLRLAEQIYLDSVKDRSAHLRNLHNEVQETINSMLSSVRLCEKGLKLVGGDLQTSLTKYLLKTLCTDVVNEILSYIATEKELAIDVKSLSNDLKLKLVNDLGADYKPLICLVKLLRGSSSSNNNSISEFFGAVEECLQLVSMIVKKMDKKKDRTIVLNYKQELIEKLTHCQDVVMVLHLAALVIFVGATQCMLYASGKHVPALVSFLKSYLTEADANELTSYCEFVTLMLSGSSEVDNVKEKLTEKVSIVQTIALNYKKTQ